MKENSDKEIKDQLARNHACYVLITCDSPLVDGRMNVEMSYEGDPVLAAYLLQGAQTYLEEQSFEEDFSNN
ncbi:MAG: hypothetical protein ACE5GN_06150 [Waddliaceae bacterium]